MAEEETNSKKRKFPSSSSSSSLFASPQSTGNDDPSGVKKPPTKVLKTQKRGNVHGKGKEKEAFVIPEDLYKPPPKSLAEIEEEEGKLEFKIIRNDGTEKSLCQLLKLKVLPFSSASHYVSSFPSGYLLETTPKDAQGLHCSFSVWLETQVILRVILIDFHETNTIMRIANPFIFPPGRLYY
jgi:hypothetical protein